MVVTDSKMLSEADEPAGIKGGWVRKLGTSRLVRYGQMIISDLKLEGHI